jgi:probable O-glycosylation ligase (exosortase A-associated)
MRQAVFLTIFGVLLPICFFRPFFGISLWTVISYLSPHRYTYGFAQNLSVGYMTAVPTLAGMVISGKFRMPPLTRETFLLALLWVWFGLTTLNVYSSNLLVHHLADTLFRFGNVSKILLMVFVATILVSDRNKLRWWYLATAGCFAFLALKATRFGVLTSGEFRVYGPPGTDLEDNNGFALALNMTLPMFLYLGGIEKSRGVRVGLRIGFFAALVGIVLSYSRGALVGLVCVLLVIALQSKYRVRALLAVAILGTLLVAVAPQQWIERMETLQTAQKTDLSAQERFHSWNFATHLALEFPILGGGFETFTTPLYQRYGLSLFTSEGNQFGPHSIYFQMLAEHGFPGLILFLTIIGSCILSGQRIKRRFRRIAPNHWLVAYAKMIIASLFAYAASGAFLGFAFFDLFYQIVGTTIILRSLATKEEMLIAAADESDLMHPEEATVSAAT